MKKALIVATVLKKHIVQFHIPTIKMLKDMGWQVDVAAANDYEGDYDVSFCDNYYDIPFSREPISFNNKTAYKQLKNIIDTQKYDVVHCHTPMGGVIARLAARDARKEGTKVFYTAHGFHFYKGAPKKNWMLYYPAEKYCSRLTDVLITINEEDYNFAKKHLEAKRIEYVPGVGIDLMKFRPRDSKKNRNSKKIMCTGELIARKNHETVIKAISLLSNKNIYCIICGDGELKLYLQNVIDNLDLHDRVKLLGYRDDIAELLNDSDLYIQPSFQEGLPLSVMEAMACKVPVLASDIRGNRDLLDQRCLFDPNDDKKLSDAIVKTFENDNLKIVNDNYRKLQDLSIHSVLNKIKEIYTSDIRGL